MVSRVLFSSTKSEWSTPQDFYDKLHEEFDFSCDVAADITNTKCLKFYDSIQDGLKQDWSGDRNWMNPPYGHGIKHWVRKAATTIYQPGCFTVGLLPARTDTKWFHEHIYPLLLIEGRVRFLKGRLKFGGSDNSAPFPSMVVVWRANDT